MNELRIRPAEAKDLPDLDRLLYQVHKVHSDARPDLFKPGAKKYTGEELKKILAEHAGLHRRAGRTGQGIRLLHSQAVSAGKQHDTGKNPLHRRPLRG